MGDDAPTTVHSGVNGYPGRQRGLVVRDSCPCTAGKVPCVTRTRAMVESFGGRCGHQGDPSPSTPDPKTDGAKLCLASLSILRSTILTEEASLHIAWTLCRVLPLTFSASLSRGIAPIASVHQFHKRKFLSRGSSPPSSGTVRVLEVGIVRRCYKRVAFLAGSRRPIGSKYRKHIA